MRRTLDLALILAFVLVVAHPLTANAVKVTLEKLPIISDEGDFLGFEDFDPVLLAGLGFSIIADYPYYLAGEITEEQLVDFTLQAENLGLLFNIRRDFDIVRINEFTFSSFSGPSDLPADLRIQEFAGNIGLFLVQFKAPPTRQWLDRLSGTAELVGYFPENTYLIRAAADAAAALERLDGVQHVSLFHPAYKIRPSLLSRDGSLDLTVALDAGQDIEAFGSFLSTLTNQPATLRTDPDHAFSRATLNRDGLLAVAHRAEVLWIEPTLTPAPSGERDASVVSGCHDGYSPVNPGSKPVRFGSTGHNGWLRSKGFNTPTDWEPWPKGITYWTKVGIIDSGLDATSCHMNKYDEVTGICTSWPATNDLHPDLDHRSNAFAACPPVAEGMAALDPLGHCPSPILRKTIFCAGDPNHNDCGPNSTGFNDYYTFSDTIGHGTSVASVIAGDPLVSGHPDPQDDLDGFFKGTGIAPSAQLVIAKSFGIPQNQGSGSGLMDHSDFKNVVAKVSGVGTRFFNNSWNVVELDHYGNPFGYDGLAANHYTLYSQAADELVRDADPSNAALDEVTIVFSAGNWEARETGQPQNTQWSRSPANAKNVISVGAARGWSGGEGLPDDDCPFDVDDPNLIRDIAGGFLFHEPDPPYLPVFWHSQRGYVNETGSGGSHPRYKPDLVAPGTMVAAARSRAAVSSELYDCFKGTSAAAPSVTGAAVLAEAWYVHKMIDGVRPSPAMIKAMLVAHADSLATGQDHWPPGSVLGHSPSSAQGWGRVNLDRLFQEDVPVMSFDQDHGDPNPIDNRRFTTTGQFWSERLQVFDEDEDTIIVMAFTDAPSALAAASLDVNDLDLRAFKFGIGPGSGFNTWGNYFDTGSWYSKITGAILPSPPGDAHNNVEVIRIPAGTFAAGDTYWVRVSARTITLNSIPTLDSGNPNQDFALYIYNAVEPGE